jgi:2,3-dihydroxybenzoate decarboxylase
MKKIALEEAIVQPGTIRLVPDHQNHLEFQDNLDNLIEIGPKRLRDMDKSDIEISVLSVTTPGLQGLATREGVENIAQDWNDYLAAQVDKYPTRLKALACIPTITAEMAVDEVNRVVKNDAFVGCMINGFDSSGNASPQYLDDPHYDPLWQALEKHNFPLYIHPRGVPDDRETTYSHFNALKGAAWGFHIETAEHVLRLMLRGIFDRYPKLRVLIGHMGEMLPFWAWRIDHRINVEGWNKITACDKSVTDYLKSNIFITTSGYFNTPALTHAISTMGIDRVLFSVDYPYEDSVSASQWLDSTPYSEEDKNKIAYANAANLLGL